MINLKNSSANDKTLEDIAECTKLPDLVSLIIKGCMNITENGIIKLVKSTTLENLKLNDILK